MKVSKELEAKDKAFVKMLDNKDKAIAALQHTLDLAQQDLANAKQNYANLSEGSNQQIALAKEAAALAVKERDEAIAKAKEAAK